MPSPIGKLSRVKQIVLTSVTLIIALSSCSGGKVPPPEPPEPPPPPPAPIECTFTFSWVNPTEDENGRILEPTELTDATLYRWRPPLTLPGDLINKIEGGIDPYVLTWQSVQGAGEWWFRLTVSNEAGESDFSNEAQKTCQ